MSPDSLVKQPRRDVHGVLLLDKPPSITSNDALQHIKRLFNAKKAGHTGSLDRSATGMLPVCFGEATKFTSYLLDADKRYRARCRLGVETATGDADGGTISERPVPALSRVDLETVLDRFRGDIQQVPPMYSAIKQNGQRLYTLAYQGIEVERKPRPVSIYELELLEFSREEIEISVHCSKGTYIRTLAVDIGNAIGCGAHIRSLVRTAVGPFCEGKGMSTAARLQELAAEGMDALDAVLLPVDAVIQDIPEVVLAASVSYFIGQGQPVMVPQTPTSGILRIYDEKHEFLGVGEVLEDGRIAPRRLVNYR